MQLLNDDQSIVHLPNLPRSLGAFDPCLFALFSLRRERLQGVEWLVAGSYTIEFLSHDDFCKSFCG